MGVNFLNNQLTFAQSKGYLPLFQASSVTHRVPLDILLAVASRETGIGSSRFFDSNYTGDHGFGVGLMQIDKRWHPGFTDKFAANDHKANIHYGAELLASLHREWRDWKKALAAYNSGSGNVRRAIRETGDPDSRTTGKDYGRDVLRRAEAIRGVLGIKVTTSSSNTPLVAGGIVATLGLIFLLRRRA